MFLADRYIKGECPNCRREGSVRRRLRELRHRLFAHEAEESGFRNTVGRARMSQVVRRLSTLAFEPLLVATCRGADFPAILRLGALGVGGLKK